MDSIDTEIGTLAYHTFYYQEDEKTADNLFYMLSYCDYPEETVHSDSSALLIPFFDATIDAAVLSVDGELIYQDYIKKDDYPGMFWRIEYLENQAVIKTKAYVVANRFYSLQVISFKAQEILMFRHQIIFSIPLSYWNESALNC